MRRLLTFLLGLLLIVGFAVPTVAQDDDTEAPTITDTVGASAVSDEPEFTSLQAALDAADPALNEALSDGDRNFTVFAPTDNAFEEALTALDITFEDLASDTALLTDILSYHVVPNDYTLSEILELDGALLGTLLPATALEVSISDEGGFINDASVIETDLFTSNGVIHVIDSVLLPPENDSPDMEEDVDDTDEMPPESVTDVVTSAAESDMPEFTVLLAAIESAGLGDILTLNGPYTIFAPTDEAFTALLADLGVSAEELLADTDLLIDVLSYHVVPGEFSAADLIAFSGAEDALFASAFDGEPLTVSVDGDDVVSVNDASVIDADIYAANGVIHVIDSVLLPPMGES